MLLLARSYLGYSEFTSRGPDVLLKTRIRRKQVGAKATQAQSGWGEREGLGAGYRGDKTWEMPKTGLWRCSGAWGHSYEGFSQRRQVRLSEKESGITQRPWKELSLFLANCTTEQVPSFINGGNLPEAGTDTAHSGQQPESL